MTRCDRYEREGLLLEEQGLPLEQHYSDCAECLESRRAHGRLRQQLAGAAENLVPRHGWKDEVWAAVARQPARPRKLFAAWALVPAGLAAAVVAVAVLRPLPHSSLPSLRVEVEAADTSPVRSGEVSPGSRLRLRARAGGTPHAELRVYFNESQVVLRCSDAPPCRRRGDELEATLVMDAIGAYQPLLLVADRPLPAPLRNVDADAGAALNAGARVELGREVQVR